MQIDRDERAERFKSTNTNRGFQTNRQRKNNERLKITNEIQLLPTMCLNQVGQFGVLRKFIYLYCQTVTGTRYIFKSPAHFK